MRGGWIFGLVAGLAAAQSPAIARAQTTPPDTVEEFVRLYGGASAARSFAASQLLAPFRSNVTLAEGCGVQPCAVDALIIEARPRTDTSSRQLCFANPVPLAARLRDEVAYGFVVHAEATITSSDGPVALGYRLFARMDTRTASRAKPNLAGEWCAALPVALREAAATGGWSVALRAIPPRDPRFTYTDLRDARLPPRTLAGVTPVRFDPNGVGYTEALIRSSRPGARIAVSGARTRLKTPATLSLTEAAAKRVEVQQGRATALLDSCASQWSAELAAFVFDCAL